MNVGEFFISLGIKGSGKTVGALNSVKTGLGDVKSMSLEAKAAIIAAVYGFEQLMKSSSQAGTNLENFNALTGISAQTLQQYQYAARQVGVSNDEMRGSFVSVQNVMTNMRLGKGAPEGLGMLQRKVGFDASKALKDTEYVMKKLQEYANSEKEVSMRNSVLKSFGLSDTVIAGMARNAFRPEVMAKAPRYNDQEVKQLDRVNAAWSNLGNKMQMAIGHFNALHGGQLVNDISKIADKVLVLVEAFMRLAEALHVFEGIGKVVDVLAMITGAGASGVKAITGAYEHPEQRKPLLDRSLQGAGQLLTSGSNKVLDFFKNQMTPQNPVSLGAMPGKSSAVAPNSTQNNNVNQTFHFQTDGSDHKQVGDAAQKGITNAYLQLQSKQGGF